MTDETHDMPSDVKRVDSTVKVTGPDDVDIVMTPEAAARTGARLLDAAAQAKGEEAFTPPKPQQDDAGNR
jgi:hypothetical protein